MFKISQILNRYKKHVAPRTYFIELAELGLLEEYLNTQFYIQFTTDMKFRQEMLEILYKHTKKPMPMLDKIYLKYLNDALESFKDKTKHLI